MSQTFEPEHRYAKAFGVNMKISHKNSMVLCRTVRNKPLSRAKRLLDDLNNRRRALEGKYYSNAAREMLRLLESCEKNAVFKGLDVEKLFVHASASFGTNIQRRRRKGAFGNTMKTTNMEILLIERGRESGKRVSKKKIREQLEGKKVKDDVKKDVEKLHEEQHKLEEKVSHMKHNPEKDE